MNKKISLNLLNQVQSKVVFYGFFFSSTSIPMLVSFYFTDSEMISTVRGYILFMYFFYILPYQSR